MFAHPECRRSLNRVARCENKGLREKAALQMLGADRRSPAIEMLAQRLRMLGKNEEKFEDNEETIAMYTECIEQDPYLPRMYILRSSVLMHLNRFDETMNDLKICDRLSPENMDVESMIALCQIRLGDTEAGLEYAEKLVVTAPRDLSSLYNGACCYSRALENPDVSDAQKKRYGDRAIELLRLTIATEWGDFAHLQVDEDLVAIHTHPEWSAVVDETKKVHAENLKKAQE
jgi:tetratricopeptide (TPR) repeat protein